MITRFLFYQYSWLVFHYCISTNEWYLLSYPDQYSRLVFYFLISTHDWYLISYPISTHDRYYSRISIHDWSSYSYPISTHVWYFIPVSVVMTDLAELYFSNYCWMLVVHSYCWGTWLASLYSAYQDAGSTASVWTTVLQSFNWSVHICCWETASIILV